MTRPVELWVEVDGRSGLELVRRTGLPSVTVVPAGGAPVYGRPGERLCVRFEGPLPGGPAAAGRAAASLPLAAGAIVAAEPGGLALVVELRRRGRGPLAVIALDAGDVAAAAAAGATAVVALDAATGGRIAPPAAEAGLAVAVVVGTMTEAEAALTVGAAGLLLPVALLPDLGDGPLVSAAVAAGGPAVRQPAPGTPFGRSAGARDATAPGATTAGRWRRPGTIGAALARATALGGRRDAVVHVAAGRRLSWLELGAEVRRLARAMLAHGVRGGDRVALWARNTPEWPLVQLAAAEIGAVLVTVNPSLAEDELNNVLDQSGAGLLIAAPRDERQAEVARRAARSGLPHEARAVVLVGSSGAAPLAGSDAAGRSLAWATFLGRAAEVPERDLDRAAGRVAPDDTAMLLYTSGTTGFPKGAMLTHRGMLRNAAAVGGNIRLGQADRLCLAVPLHHCFGSVMGTLACLSYLATLVIPADWFDAGAVLGSIARERCSVLYGVPTMFMAELDHPDRPRTDLASLRTGIVAGAPVPPDLAERAARDLHLPELVVAYGLTEASPVVTQTSPTDPPELRLGTVGRPIAGAEVRIVRPDGAALAPGVVGELVTRGPMVMQGYFDLPDETRAAIDRDGWLHTGDLATRDARGYIRIVGRLKDMIIRGGENVYPAEVEAVGRRFPGLADVEVVGVPSDRFGEEVAAAVRPSPGAPVPSEAALREHFAVHLAPFKVPRWIVTLEAFPMTASGKVRKGELRELVLAALRGEWRDARDESRPEAGLDAADLGSSPGSSLGGGPALPWLEPKPSVPGDPGDPSRRGAVREPGAPIPDSGRLPSRPARPGWQRPAGPAWQWPTPAPSPTLTSTRAASPTASASDGPASQHKESNMSLDNVRRRGQRIKTWGIGGNVREQIEATGELPIMYRALGTPPQTQHPFNLYGDIRSQPEALRGTFETAHEIADVARRLAQHDPVGLIGLGSGTSQFVAQVANAVFTRFAGVAGWDYDSLHFLRYPPGVDFRRFGVMAYSGSGSTVDTVAATKRSRDAGAFTVAFTSVEGSPVVQASDARILTAGGFDTGGSDTFHYTTRVAAAIYLALELGKLRRPRTEDHDGLLRALVDTARQMGEIFDTVDARCRTIAERFMGVRSILVVGDGPNYGTAEEIALKFDEMAHIPTKPMNPGRHIHGALGLTDEQILTVLVAPPGPSYRDMVSIAKVTQLLKTPAVAIVSEDDTEIADIVDYVVRLPVRDEAIFPVLAVLPGQLLPYWCGVGLGLNPDTQRSNIPKHARVWNMLFPPGTH